MGVHHADKLGAISDTSVVGNSSWAHLARTRSRVNR
jgi:hypothetical protein